MDIYELQKTEHEKILQLLSLIAEVEEPEIANAFNRFRTELSAHKIAEEQTFFKLLQEKDNALKQQIDIIKAEHVKLEELFNKLCRSAVETDELKVGLSQLNAVLTSDIAEEARLLTIAKTLLTPEEAENIAKEMTTCKLNFEQRLSDRLNP
ncbi:MAG: hemerythrin cation binding protein [Gammaproteobacteria bacterium]|nr:hemerythrin cation binding protein [Gammaproteobacteria bacterium]